MLCVNPCRASCSSHFGIMSVAEIVRSAQFNVDIAGIGSHSVGCRAELYILDKPCSMHAVGRTSYSPAGATNIESNNKQDECWVFSSMEWNACGTHSRIPPYKQTEKNTKLLDVLCWLDVVETLAQELIDDVVRYRCRIAFSPLPAATCYLHAYWRLLYHKRVTWIALDAWFALIAAVKRVRPSNSAQYWPIRFRLALHMPNMPWNAIRSIQMYSSDAEWSDITWRTTIYPNQFDRINGKHFVQQKQTWNEWTDRQCKLNFTFDRP